MTSLLSAPQALFKDALRTVDKQLENVALAADALQRGRSKLPPVTSDFNEDERQSFISKTIGAIRDQVQRGLPVTSIPSKTLIALLDAFAASKKWEEGIDDRKLFLDYVFVFLSRAPSTQQTKELEHGAIKLLYRDLPHPPSTHMGPEYQFRSFDASGNAATVPDMGRSFTPYSRSCSSLTPLPADELPDPGLVFDMLIRRDKFVPHPAGLSGLFFNWATTVIHSVFRTRRTNWNINETSSYVDLGILYGNTRYHVDRMRIVDGQGKIIPDSIAETRIASLPPGVTAILIMFNRNHNWIAEHLLQINERKTWKNISEFNEDEKRELIYSGENYQTVLEKQDYEIFQTARLINSLTYANVVLSDFLSGILGTQRDGSAWSLDISSERREDDHTFLERGTGNSCSIEFNVLYRLHPSMSEKDEEYIQKTFGLIFKDGEQWDDLTPELFELRVTDFGKGRTTSIEEYRTKTEFERNQEKDDSQPRDYLKSTHLWVAARDPETKRFNDADLANYLHEATQVPAAAFKARGVPNVMRVIEILGIQQARKWGACTMNEFRRFLGLRPYATFEDWNPDPVVADAARKLYRHPENLELYVGLVAEEPKPVGPGAGLCPSYTMARAILADAVALVRGDRYLTYDGTPYNLTSWGFTEGARDVKNAAFGGTLSRLFNRGLPQYFPAESVYTHFPLVTPTGQRYSMDNVLRDLGKYEDYTFNRPTKTGDTFLVNDPDLIYNIISDPSSGFVTTYGPQIKEVGLEPSFLSAIDDPVKFDKVVQLIQDLFVPREELAKTLLWFHDRTLELIREKNLPIINVRTDAHAIDVVKDVFRLVPVHWASTRVAGLPLKTSFEPHGIYYEQQIYQMLSEIYSYIYTEVDATRKIPYRHEARGNVDRLGRFVKLALLEAMGGLPASVLGSVSSLFLGDGRNTGNATLKRILALKSPLDESANDIIGVISTASIELSQIFSHVVNFYLAPAKPGLLDADYDEQTKIYDEKLKLQAKLVALATQPTADAPEQLAGYVREALRLDPVVDGVYRKATVAKEYAGTKYNKGDKVYLNYRAAGRFSKFRNPTEIDPTRPIDDYKGLQGDTVFKVLGQDFVYGAAANVLRAVYSLNNVRRANGPAGTLRRFKENFIAPPDKLDCTDEETDVDQIVLGDDGKPVKQDNPKKETVIKYKWISSQISDPADGIVDTAWKFKYCNPEDNHRLTQWATGLTLNYDG